VINFNKEWITPAPFLASIVPSVKYEMKNTKKVLLVAEEKIELFDFTIRVPKKQGHSGSVTTSNFYLKAGSHRPVASLCSTGRNYNQTLRVWEISR
jgi:hypothetical protein